MAKTASQFDQWMEKKRQRPIGICSECGREQELRQLEPEPLCGACLEKLRRAEVRENDPAASRKDAKKREKKIRSEMNKVLNVVDALDGLVPDEHLNVLSSVAKIHLKPILEGPDGGGHGHEETERDRDMESAANGSGEPSGVGPASPADQPTPAENGAKPEEPSAAGPAEGVCGARKPTRSTRKKHAAREETGYETPPSVPDEVANDLANDPKCLEYMKAPL